MKKNEYKKLEDELITQFRLKSEIGKLIDINLNKTKEIITETRKIQIDLYEKKKNEINDYLIVYYKLLDTITVILKILIPIFATSFLFAQNPFKIFNLEYSVSNGIPIFVILIFIGILIIYKVHIEIIDKRKEVYNYFTEKIEGETEGQIQNQIDEIEQLLKEIKNYQKEIDKVNSYIKENWIEVK